MQPETTFLESNLNCLITPFRFQAPGKVGARLSLLIAGLILVCGCTASADNEVEALLDEDFQLRVGQSALIKSVEMEIGFEGITSDSRCGKGENCFTEGDAIVRIWMRQAGGSRDENVLHTESSLPSAVVFAGHTIRLVALDPPAIAGRDIEPTEYVATIRVVPGLSGDAIF